VGAAAVYGYMSHRRDTGRLVTVNTTAQPNVTSLKHPALRYGLPIKERIRFFTGYVAGYDPSTRNPLWVLEHLNKANAYGDAKRSDDFFEDKVCQKKFKCFFSRLRRISEPQTESQGACPGSQGPYLRQLHATYE
jgi:DNA/RNA endonuclease G (NUC1)